MEESPIFSRGASFIVVCFLGCFPSWGAEAPFQQLPVPTRETCRHWMVDTPPAPDVAFKPGLDAQGRPVAPADLEGTLEIPSPKGHVSLEAGLKSFLPTEDGDEKVPAPLDALEEKSSLDLGSVLVYEDGRTYLNGQPLFNEELWAFKKACQKLLSQESPRG